jgi:hypothetical protein
MISTRLSFIGSFASAFSFFVRRLLIPEQAGCPFDETGKDAYVTCHAAT